MQADRRAVSSGVSIRRPQDLVLEEFHRRLSADPVWLGSRMLMIGLSVGVPEFAGDPRKQDHWPDTMDSLLKAWNRAQ